VRRLTDLIELILSLILTFDIRLHFIMRFVYIRSTFWRNVCDRFPYILVMFVRRVGFVRQERESGRERERERERERDRRKRETGAEGAGSVYPPLLLL
jgi:hypothetical protein